MERDADAVDGGLARLSAGSTQLDLILGGGFPANSINIVMGEPGSGKTILVERLIFANARADERPILYLTTLSEPLDKVVRYLQQFSFFDASHLGTTVLYESVGDDLLAEGARMLVPRLKEAITTLKPKIICIDSFKAIHDLDTPLPELRKVLYELAGMLTAYETTAFLLGEYGTNDIARYPEFAVADGIVELARNTTGIRDERYLRVLKLRGSSYREGTHAFHISRNGLDVSPRLVSPPMPPSYSVKTERVSTGVPGLDEMLDGGLPKGRSTFIVGPTGSGKTTLCLQLALNGVHQRVKTLYVTFEENPSQLAQQILALGMQPEEAIRDGLQIMYRSAVELQIDSIIGDIFAAVATGGVRRVIIDGIGDLMIAANDRQRLHGYLYALAQHFSVRDVIGVFIYEMAGQPQQMESRLSALADNIIHLDVELAPKVRRTIRIVKARGVEHTLDKKALKIMKDGVQVL